MVLLVVLAVLVVLVVLVVLLVPGRVGPRLCRQRGGAPSAELRLVAPLGSWGAIRPGSSGCVMRDMAVVARRA